MSFKNEVLETYFRNHVQMKCDETKKSVGIVMPVIDKILREIKKKDSRFTVQPVYAGSHWQNLKVERADEFDVSVILSLPETSSRCSDPLRCFGFDRDVDDPLKSIPYDLQIIRGPRSLPSPPPGYCCWKLQENESPPMPSWSNLTNMTFDGYLVPFLVKKQFHGLLNEAIRDLNLQKTVSMRGRVNGPALTIRIAQQGHFCIDVDFSVITEAFLPFPSEIQWPHRNAKWPSLEKVVDIRGTGVQTVAKKNFDWIISFLKAEKKLIENIDSDGGCRKKSHRIMKKLNEDVWCDTTSRVITSYCLKNILFWECEDSPYSEDWSVDKLSVRVTSMIERVKKAAQARSLPMYFNPAVNLLQDKDCRELDIAVKKISDFMKCPDKSFMKRGVLPISK
ncbi:protein mab-21-like 3 [Lingula anatina]|uniref:Protein mab-21-like 3 n=1 Tax=Lingula anatina TaxID=7574 RepID=A0A1S3J0S9_LINAN|nr:protein mab-21-like 3 [Lingula anatina]|eukprot:XP_013403868.1 protein mab-21-like 3 [Lingula anatina]